MAVSGCFLGRGPVRSGRGFSRCGGPGAFGCLPTLMQARPVSVHSRGNGTWGTTVTCPRPPACQRTQVAKPGTFPHDPAPIPEPWHGLRGHLDFRSSCVLGIQCSAFVFLKFFFVLFRDVCLFIRLCWVSGVALRILTVLCESFPCSPRTLWLWHVGMCGG